MTYLKRGTNTHKCPVPLDHPLDGDVWLCDHCGNIFGYRYHDGGWNRLRWPTTLYWQRRARKQ